MVTLYRISFVDSKLATTLHISIIDSGNKRVKNTIIFSRLLFFIGLLLLTGKKYVYPLLRKTSCPYSSAFKGHKAFVW